MARRDGKEKKHITIIRKGAPVGVNMNFAIDCGGVGWDGKGRKKAE